MVQFVYFVKYLHLCLWVPQENRMDIFKERNKLELMNLDDLILLRIPKYRINCRQNIDNLIFVVYNERVFPSLLLLSQKGINCSVELLESSCELGYCTYLPIFYNQTDVYANHTCSNSRSSVSVNHFKITMSLRHKMY